MASRQQQRTAKGSGPNGRPTKAERRELARRERDELRRKVARARRNRRIATWTILAVAIAGGIWLYTRDEDAGSDAARPLPGVLTAPAPWSNNVEQMGDRLDLLDLPRAGAALHIHSHLSLFVAGEQVSVPADIGVSGSLHAPLHSHDSNGVVHVESADASSTFTLGEYFDVWGVRLSSTCLGGYCEQGQRSLHVFVDGEEFSGDPRQIELADQEEITIAFGTDEDVPDPLPTYNWDELVG